MKNILLKSLTPILLLVLLTGHLAAAQDTYDPPVDPNERPEAYADWKQRLSPQANPVRIDAPRFNATTSAAREPDGDGLLVPLDDSFTPVPRNDDGSLGPITLPFTFNLYGSTYDEVWINTNGNLTFTSGFGGYTPDGFPIDLPMVAGFWADVDTRLDGSPPESGQIYYKLESNRLIVIWDSVGYYGTNADKVNTFEIIITDGTDPLVGTGKNVAFSYADMQWTTGDASGGTGGFGGAAATAGLNKGDGSTFVQIGRFDHPGTDYDGPFNTTDGVDYLDERDFFFDATEATNLPPVASNFDPGDTLEVAAGETLTDTLSFISPEGNQTTSIMVDAGGLANFSATTTAGNPASAEITFTPDASQVGFHTIALTATDDGSPPKSTTAELILQVTGEAVDTMPPVCEVIGVSPAFGTFTAEATDNSAGDTGIASVLFSADAVNISHYELLDGFDQSRADPGDLVELDPTEPRVEFVAIGPPYTTSTGTVTVTDAAGNTCTYDILIPPAPATVTFNDQVSDGMHVTVAEVFLLEDGYVAIHDTSLLSGNVLGSVIGVSEYLTAGTHTDLTVTLFEGVPGADFPADTSLPGPQTLIAMPHQETSGNEVYNFLTSGGTEDAAYLNEEGSAITDPAFITLQVADASPPVCGPIDIEFNSEGELSAVNTSASDAESGIASVAFTRLRNLNGFVDGNGPFGEGDTYTTPDPDPSMVEIRGERISFSQGGAIVTTVTNGAGLSAQCDPVVETLTAKVPERFSLEGNYPNPFSDQTTITFSVAEPVEVTIAVYDVLGRKVATLVDEELSPQTYRIRWDGRNEAGRALASGVYFYRIEAGSFTATRQMMLLK